MPPPVDLRFELRPRRPSRALRAALLLMLLVTVGLFANWLVPQWRLYRQGEAEGAGISVVQSVASEAASAPARDATAVLDDRLHEAEQCVKGSATLHRFTYDAAERSASMHITLGEPEALNVLMDCLEANTTGTERWTLLSYEAVDRAAADGGAQRSSRIVLSSSPHSKR